MIWENFKKSLMKDLNTRIQSHANEADRESPGDSEESARSNGRRDGWDEGDD